MVSRSFLVFLLITILHYTICHGFFNRGDGLGSSGIAGFGTRSGYRGTGESNLSQFGNAVRGGIL